MKAIEIDCLASSPISLYSLTARHFRNGHQGVQIEQSLRMYGVVYIAAGAKLYNTRMHVQAINPVSCYPAVVVCQKKDRRRRC